MKPTEDRANIVKPEEMEESQWFVVEMLQALTVRNAHVEAQATCVKQGWGDLQVGRSCDGAPLVLAGRPFTSGLGTHASSEIIVRLPAGAKRLTGWCGVNQSPLTEIDEQAVFEPRGFQVAENLGLVLRRE